jgi:hypothetical protein
MVWRVAFAVLVSSSALMILGAWATGSASNPVLTAALLAGAPAFLIVTLLVVIGTIAVGTALVGQWNDPHGRPVVFGFAHAATVFLTSLGFLMFAVVCLNDFRRPVLSAWPPSRRWWSSRRRKSDLRLWRSPDRCGLHSWCPALAVGAG